jgi:hypothetical protein
MPGRRPLGVPLSNCEKWIFLAWKDDGDIQRYLFRRRRFATFLR